VGRSYAPSKSESILMVDMHRCSVLRQRKFALALPMTCEIERQLIQETDLTAESPLKMGHREKVSFAVKTDFWYNSVN
jgi:hypothetical protein